MEVPVFAFSGTPYAYRENMSMTFKRYLNLWLCIERELKSARSISQISSIFVTITDYEESFYEQVC